MAAIASNRPHTTELSKIIENRRSKPIPPYCYQKPGSGKDLFTLTGLAPGKMIIAPEFTNRLSADGTKIRTEGNKCCWCRCTFDGIPIGIPIRDEVIQFSPDGHKIYIFEVCMSYCSFPCAYAEIINGSSGSLNEYFEMYKLAAPRLVRLFHLIYPEAKLIMAPRWFLHEINNGPLSAAEFTSLCGKFEFRPTGNVVLLTVALEMSVCERISPI